MASNHGFPPPPPPPPPPRSYGATPAAPFQRVNDVGSLCPPPPPQSNTQYNHQQMQSMHSMPHHAMQHHGYQQQPPSYQQQHPSNLPPNSQYQHYQTGQPALQPHFYQQQQMHQQQQHYNQYSYPPQYANYAAPPPPPSMQQAANTNYAAPPPPPSHRQAAQHHNNHSPKNTNQSVTGSNGHSTNENVAASLRQSLSPKIENATAKPKKINPKMVKKYSGRGLKTITVSGPGMPTKRFKICVGNHPDDIQKWIEERKKRFPRVDGSHKNNASNKEAVGEVAIDSIGTKRSRQEEGEQENMAIKRTCPDEKAKKEGTETGGLSSLLAGYDSSSSQDKGSDSKDTPKKDASPSGAVPSSEGDSAKSPADLSTSQPKPTRICTYYQRGKCRHGTSCKFLHSEPDPNQRLKKSQSQSARDKARNQGERELQILGLATPSHGSRYTSGGKVINSTSLLHKLLQRDKERERRLALQLLRYIADCEYFQDGNTSISNGEVDADDGKQP